jgi:hypothetical protein
MYLSVHIGYALGRIEVLDPQPRLVPGAPVLGANGHVSSIAVLENYRGQGKYVCVCVCIYIYIYICNVHLNESIYLEYLYMYLYV